MADLNWDDLFEGLKCQESTTVGARSAIGKSIFEEVEGVTFHAGSKPKQTKEESNMADKVWQPEEFTFTGQRVMLNPESTNYNYLKEQFGGADVGYVTDMKCSHRDLPIVLRSGNSHIPGWSVEVTADNGRKEPINVRDLLQIDKFKESTYYKYGRGKARYVLDGESKAFIDDDIIRNNRELLETIHISREWVDAKIKEAKEYISARS
jgi:hypothetical protein